MSENSGGYSIQGCNYIYAPKGQAGEYARLAANPYRGCGHGCAYCYVPAALRMGADDKKAFHAGAVVRPNFLKHLAHDAVKYEAAGIHERVLLSFTTDPYHPGDTSATRQAILILQNCGMSVTVLTKGGTRAIRDLNLFRPGLDHFATTLTSANPDFSRRWEPRAATPFDRMATLRAFHSEGVFTWVSLEPVLSVDETMRVIDVSANYVDFYKVGKANYITLPEPIDWRKFTSDVTGLLSSMGKAHYVKKDLQAYLPDGYVNTRLEEVA